MTDQNRYRHLAKSCQHSALIMWQPPIVQLPTSDKPQDQAIRFAAILPSNPEPQRHRRWLWSCENDFRQCGWSRHHPLPCHRLSASGHSGTCQCQACSTHWYKGGSEIRPHPAREYQFCQALRHQAIQLLLALP